VSGGGGRSRHVTLLVGLGLGVALGVIANLVWGESSGLDWVVRNLTEPVGRIFIRLLLMLVAPLLFAALVMGIAELDLKHLGRLGLRMMVYTVVVSAIAVGIGLALVNALRPGDYLSDEARAVARRGKASSVLAPVAEVMALPDDVAARIVVKDVVPVAPPSEGVADTLVAMVPDNVLGAASSNAGLLGLIVFSLFFGVALAVTKSDGAARLREMIQGLYDVMMTLIDAVMRMAPVGVGALLFSMVARLGFDILGQLAVYVGVVLLALGLHMFVVYPLSVRFFGGMSPIAFFRGSRLAILTAFSTASSNATLPTALRVADEELRLPRHVSRFVLTAGSAMNQNGTALFEGVTVLFLAQVFGVELDLGQQLTVMLICVLGGVGTAGVPAGSLPVVAMILVRFGIPAEGLGHILGVDRFLDMCRTSLNVTGDLAAAVYVARGEARDQLSASTSGS
jgi:DAACS family dicarboxylate/amino acid:cation (Na+ or H+) symporter